MQGPGSDWAKPCVLSGQKPADQLPVELALGENNLIGSFGETSSGGADGHGVAFAAGAVLVELDQVNTALECL